MSIHFNSFDISDRQPYYNFTLYHRNSFVPNKYHKRTKHCYEGTYIGGYLGFHFGFTNDNKSRTFFSYWGEISTPIFYLYSSHGKEIRGDFDLRVNVGESLLVCFNSEEKIFLMIYGDRIETRKISDFIDYKTWYPFLDAGYSTPQENPSHVSVNFGYSPFINTMQRC